MCGGRSGSHVRGLGASRFLWISYGVTELLYMLNTFYGLSGVTVRREPGVDVECTVGDPRAGCDGAVRIERGERVG